MLPLFVFRPYHISIDAVDAVHGIRTWGRKIMVGEDGSTELWRLWAGALV